MRIIVIGLACLLFTGAQPAVAAPAHPVASSPRPADWQSRVKAAEELARLTQPEDLVVTTALRDMDRNMVAAMQSNDQFKEIEATLPGFSKRYYAAARPDLEKIFHARLPKMWDAVAEAFASEMTVPEINAATKFFSSPVGAKIVRLQTENMNAKSLIDVGLKDGLSDNGPSKEAADSLKSASVNAALSTVADLAPAERSAMIAFGVSPAGRAVRRAGPLIQKAILDWSTEHDPAAETRMAEIAVSVVAAMKQEQQAK